MRKQIPKSIEAEVLVKSRRRCCICFGLNRDEDVKKGQVAHLDKNSSNNAYDNLAFLCFHHHDEYDSKTSQSKNLTIPEVKKYRNELYRHFNDWNISRSIDNLLNFLASTIDNQAIADAAMKIRASAFQEALSFEALTRKEMCSCDGDIYLPYLITLDHLASWGLLTFVDEEFEDEYQCKNIRITVQHEPICKEIAKLIKETVKKNGKDTMISWIEQLDTKYNT